MSTRTIRPKSWLWLSASLASFLVYLGICCAGSVRAEDGLPDRAKPMQVVLVHDARPGCAPSCAEWISAQGQIAPGTSAVFIRALRSIGHRNVPIFIDSLGGSIEDAMAIGRQIRARHLGVVVTRTAFETCKPASGTTCPRPSPGMRIGQPHGIGAVCASACVLVLAAGSPRAAAPWTSVGVHQIIQHGTQTQIRRLYRVVTRTENGVQSIVSRTLIEERPVSVRHFTAKPARSSYDHVASYLAAMGIGAALMPLMLATPPSGIHWLSRDEEQTTRLVTDPVDGEYLVAKTRPADQPTVPDKAQVLGTSTPEQAFLIVAGNDSAKPKVSVGRTTWRIERTGSPSDAGTDVMLQSDMEISDAGMHVSIKISHPVATDAALLIDVAFSPSSNAPFHTVERIGLPVVRTIDPAQTFTLPGTIRTSGSNSFQIRLTGDPAQLELDRQLIEQRPWIDIPMRIEGGVAAKIAVEHASSGAPLLQQALKAWGDKAKNGTPTPISMETAPN